MYRVNTYVCSRLIWISGQNDFNLVKFLNSLLSLFTIMNTRQKEIGHF